MNKINDIERFEFKKPTIRNSDKWISEIWRSVTLSSLYAKMFCRSLNKLEGYEYSRR